MSSQVAENYQLKWHSHLTNLNTSVSTLYRNEKFADVMLFASNSEGGVGIPAHKIILSSCSHYFASIFDSNPSPPNAMVYIVLPPELSKRSITTLVQYMYSGEATVSNDILNEVLRGGEVLKVRGLWRNNQTSEPNASSTPHCPPAHKSDQCTKDPHQIIAEKPIYEHRIPQITSAVTESPVIVMSSQPQSQQHQQSNKSMQNIAANREIINNEPIETAAIPTSHYGLVSLQIAAAVKKAQQNSEKRVKSVSVYPKNLSESVRRYSDDQSKEIEAGHIRVKEGEVLRMSDRRRSSVSETNADPCEKVTMKYSSGPIIVEKKASDVHIPEALSFLTIKQEPTEWSDYEQENGIDKPQIEVTVKPEILYADEEPVESEEDLDDREQMIYSPLTCELCSETFTVPAEWVRHIESHAESTHCHVPKKRKRLDLSEPSCENIAALRCDLCSMYFVTPAEWVRHVQNTHTETELALSNNSTPPKRNYRPIRPLEGQVLEKSCSICKKTFPSYASMVIHKRTHTGERPFYCSLCNKGFNVKSNLLRHMRTLHNQLLNPSNLNDYSDGPNQEFDNA
ncbi:zinc finger protein 567 isoform X1 [Bradysia coprophila]|uniref:zinc finger protein 567 isoform X1 n=1 Tax=Bradysia coprophila TaxID=38358 RepID=UPI00187D870E|nr:zinc finger protein 567 isoform X1 [Bradysia coprophila]XP_037044675.1 zinc finger protein 567 isoform X1 [Bradysia coprophila]XP_037044676.1 zinc finger protein 567 isoform X1 [Bradysia coprophila]XP_037044677.1 zinc finger protein 567 isoform X1 [Bradysia coprophila]